MLIDLVGDAKEIKFLTGVRDHLQFPSREYFSGGIDRSTENNGAQRKRAGILEITAPGPQFVFIQFQIRAMELQNLRTPAQLFEYATVIGIVRFEDDRRGVLQICVR